jgi:acyl dehydratase
MKIGSIYEDEWVSLTEQTIKSFSEASGDTQWIHFGPDAIVPGMLLLSIAMRPLSFIECNKMIIAKIDNCKFYRPVKVNETVRRRIEILEDNQVDETCQSLKVLIMVQHQTLGKTVSQCHATFYYYV